jgi:DNA-binding CsgD family transcriptional regulator
MSLQRSKPAGQRLLLVTKPLDPPLHTREVRPEPSTGATERPSLPPQEIVLDGRKYLLVPVEGEPSAPTSLPPQAPGRVPTPDLLTARELQIVALVAEGRANKQIAAELFISEWTVSSHLRRIYAKLDVDTRAAMVNRCFDALSSRGLRAGG